VGQVGNLRPIVNRPAQSHENGAPVYIGEAIAVDELVSFLNEKKVPGIKSSSLHASPKNKDLITASRTNY
jgi:hypothetical protein